MSILIDFKKRCKDRDLQDPKARKERNISVLNIKRKNTKKDDWRQAFAMLKRMHRTRRVETGVCRPGSTYPGMVMKEMWVWGYERRRMGDNEVF